MKNAKLTALLLGFSLTLTMLSACGGGGASQAAPAQESAPAPESTAQPVAPSEAQPADNAGEKTLTFALIPKTLNNPFFVAMADSAQAKADELGVKLEVVAPASESDIEEQINMFESMLEKKVDGIMVVPNGTSEIVSSIEKANGMNIPVVCLDTTAEGGELLTFIGTDNVGGGEMAAKWVGDNLEAGKIAIITGTPGNKTQEDRIKGFTDAIAAYEGFSIVGDAVPSYSDRAQAMTAAENLLTAYPDLKVVYCVNDEIGLGVSEAVEAAGKTGQVAIVGFDGAPEASQAIIDGKITATLAQEPGSMGSKGVEALYEHQVNGVEPEDYTATGCSVANAENAKDYLEWH